MITHERIFRSHCLTKEWNNAMLKKALRTGFVEIKDSQVFCQVSVKPEANVRCRRELLHEQ